MIRFEHNVSQDSQAGLTSASASSRVQWSRPAASAPLPPSISQAISQERSERASAMIVVALTLACTVLALYDLLLLAAGS